MGSEELQTARWKKICKRLKFTLPPVCCRCGNDIDLSLSGRHPYGWTLDHLVPRAIDPSRIFDESNLRPAHHDCNSRAGSSYTPEVNASQDWG